MSDFTATIVGNSQRAKEWSEVLGLTVPIKSFLPKRVVLPGLGERMVYMMDIAALDDGQCQRLIAYLSKKFNLTSEQVRIELQTIGVPILADDIMITIHNPQRWL